MPFTAPAETAMTNKNALFIERAQELYQSDPLAAAIMLTGGVRQVLESYGMPLDPPRVEPNRHLLYPEIYSLPTVPEQRLDMSRHNLARTAQEAASGTAPDPDDWELDLSIAQNALQLVEQLYG